MTTNTASQLGAGENNAAPVRAGDVVVDKYVIEQTLGVGGMGVVVAARDQVLDRRVAIKFLLPKLAGSDTSVQRFVREARAATRITSEHVVRLLEIEKLPSGTPFFVMEYLEGSDLRGLLRERGALPPSVAVDYVLQALQAVAEGHVKGIVHRDIKPSNLFLTSRADGTPLIKVLDFGIAKTTESDAVESTSLTSSDDVRLGSPAYMPPEQLQNPRDVDKRSDIWSLGATLYELLCARPPFEGPGYLELASHILSQPPIPLSDRNVPDTLPSGLEQVLRKCLEKDRGARYANAGELAAALAPFGSDDARVSLTRVSGMLGASSSFPALTRVTAIDEESCDPTLDVAGSGAPSSRSDRRTSDIGAVASSPPPQRSRNFIVVAVAAVALVAIFALRGVLPLASRGPESVPRGIEAAVPAVEPTTAAVVAAAPAFVELAPTPSGSAAMEVMPATTAVPATKPVAVAVGHTSPVSPAATTVARSMPMAVQRSTGPKPAQSTKLVEAATTSSATPSSAASASPDDSNVVGQGRSAEIERLIERRR